MAKFSLYMGTFICQECEEEVDRSRYWPDTSELTWQCSKSHVSKVDL